MKHRRLTIGRWRVDFLFAREEYDVDEVLSLMYECNASPSLCARAKRLMQSGRVNTGFTFSDSDDYRAIVAIGPASSGEQFVNTLSHEIHHLAVAVASALGIDLEEETPAYIAGDTSMELIKTICEFGCNCGIDK